MSFEPKTWQCGDVISADDLNRLEGGVEEALQSSGGFSCTESYQTLTEESVTTVEQSADTHGAAGVLSYAEPITADVIKVTFDGTVYEAEKKSFMGTEYYGGEPNPTTGGIDFSQFPFFIQYDDANLLATENAGTYSLKIEALGTSVETTPCFEKAVKSVAKPLMVKFTNASGNRYYFDKSFEQVQEAFLNGREVILEWGSFMADTWTIEEYIALTSIDITGKYVKFFSDTLRSPEQEGGNLYAEVSA